MVLQLGDYNFGAFGLSRQEGFIGVGAIDRSRVNYLFGVYEEQRWIIKTGLKLH